MSATFSVAEWAAALAGTLGALGAFITVLVNLHTLRGTAAKVEQVKATASEVHELVKNGAASAPAPAPGGSRK